jgi:hypothetical protein
MNGIVDGTYTYLWFKVFVCILKSYVLLVTMVISWIEISLEL